MEENKVLDYEGLRTLVAFINIFFSKKEEIQRALNNLSIFRVVEELPTVGIKSNVIYFVPKEDTSDGNLYDEYVYINNSWELVGSVNIDLSNYYNKEEINTLLEDKVSVEEGKGLSTEDYTTSEKSKLEGIESNAEVNIIDEVKVNGTSQAVVDKSVDITIPTALSEFTNDENFIDNTVNDLVNYYKTSETYSKSEVDQLISTIPNFSISVVAALPTQDISTTTIYLVSNSGSSTNVYDEYIYVNNNWELIGTTETDLSDYYSKNQVDGLLDDKVDKVSGKGLSTNDYTNEEVIKLSGIESGAEVNDIDTIRVNGVTQTITNKAVDISVPTNNNQLTNGAGYTTQSDINNAVTNRAIYLGKINQYDTSAKALDITNYPSNTRIILKHNDSSYYMYIKFKTYTRQISLPAGASSSNSNTTVLNNLYYLDINSITSTTCQLAFTWTQVYEFGTVVSIYKGVDYNYSYSNVWTVKDNQYTLVNKPTIAIKETSTGVLNNDDLLKVVKIVKQTLSKEDNIQAFNFQLIYADESICTLNLTTNESSYIVFRGTYIGRRPDTNNFYTGYRAFLQINFNSSSYAITNYNLTSTDIGKLVDPSNYYTKSEIDTLIGNTEAILDDVINGEEE